MLNQQHPAVQLKMATKAAHQKTEQLSYSAKIISGQLRLEEYSLLMATHYAVYQTVYDFTGHELPTSHPLQQYIDVHCIQHICTDLKHLNRTPTIFPSSPSLLKEPGSCEASSCGALYVLEGSRLGARVVLKHLRQSKTFEGFKAFNFYQHQISAKPGHWKKFLELTAKLLTTPEQVRKATSSAISTFQLYQHYLSHLPIA